MNSSQQADSNQADQAAIDAIVRTFFAAFCNQEQRVPQLDALRSLFSHDAIIAKRSNGSLETMSVDNFIEPRQALLSSGALTDFSEWEEQSQTIILGGLACRWSTYSKSGFMHGEPYCGAGKKVFSFVRVGEGWKIVSAVWEDED